MDAMPELTAQDLTYLRRCVDLAREALEHGAVRVDQHRPEGLVAVLHQDRNRTAGGDQTRHPELEMAQWAAIHVAPDVRPGCTVYTSGEHCPMCAAGHAWVGLGRIVYAASSAQLTEWRQGWGLPPAPVAPLPISTVAPGLPVAGPAPELADELRELHRRLAERQRGS
jgi:tRNA(Arg) A34 adenosine deaminase TadA